MLLLRSFAYLLAGASIGWADDPRPAAGAELASGMFVYMADAARFTPCKTGRDYPVAQEGDYLRLERAYVAAEREPGQPLMATLDVAVEDRPRFDADGTAPTVIVARFVHLWPDETCERNRADASPTNTWWRIVRLGDEDVRPEPGRREPHLLLRTDGARYEATVGCNPMAGTYDLGARTLRFHEGASTPTPCPLPLAEAERRLTETLAATTGWRITGQVLELANGDGRPVALLQAVYLR